MKSYTPAVLTDVVAQVGERLGDGVARTFRNCLLDTLDHTIELRPDGTAFVITGDIPAMWLRDSTTQLTPYLHMLDEDARLADTVAAVVRTQFRNILRDPYANAFNASANGEGHSTDRTERSPWVWERKYEIDSLAYPIQLAHDLWTRTRRTDHLDDFPEVARTVIDLWRREQRHDALSAYRFERIDGPASDTLPRDGRGPRHGYTAMTWAAFRPSDDACRFSYNVPGNMFASVELSHIGEIARAVFGDDALAVDAEELRDDLSRGIAQHAIRTAGSRSVYAYEVDGLGGSLLMDDANAPSLLSLPLFGWCADDDPVYLDTRDFILSAENPHFASGRFAAGVGSPHTPAGWIWPIALAIQGLTARDEEEKARLLDLLVRSDAGTGLMHESFHKDDPSRFTRPWFSWANAMFCDLALDLCGLRTHRREPIAVGR